MALQDTVRHFPKLASAALLGALLAQPAHAETRSYAIEWFSLASSSQDGDCPGGINPPTRLQYFKSLELLGYSPDEVKQIMADFAVPGMKHANAANILRNRGRVDGKPVN